VASVQKVSAEQAFDNLKASLGDDANVLEGFNETLASASFIVKLKNSQMSSNVMEQIKLIPGVRKVSYFQEVIDFISKFTYWINLVSLFLLLILLIISVFIISNTIKLTVFARRREISIMKYIGATDWFIRWPFVVEGILIGILGAIVAFLLTRYTYGTIEFRFNKDLTALSENFISLIKTGEISLRLLGYFILLGSGVGAIGSVISISKYLRV
jgi:cell division transport system permease protein